MSSTTLAFAIGPFDFSFARLLLGLFAGLVYGLLAVGLVLVYRASRFINFAHGSIGVFGAAVVGVLAGKLGLPYWPAFIVGLAAAALVAAVTEVGLIRRLKNAPRLIGMVVTLGLAQFLAVFALIINQDNVTGQKFPQPAGFPSFEVGGLPIGPPYVAMLVLTPFLFVALALFLKRSRFGLAIRAASDNPDAASLAGVSAPRMSTLTWAIAGVIAAFSATLVWPTQGLVTTESLGPSLLLKGLAAACIARFTSITIAFVSSLALGVIEQILLSANIAGIVDLVLFLIIAVALLLQPRLSRRDEDRGDWSRLAPPPLPTAYRRVFAIRHLDKLLYLLFFAGAVGLIFVSSNSRLSLLASLVGFAIVVMSVTIVTGLAGQLSLGQFAFAGIGAAVSINVVNLTNNFWIGLAAGLVAAAGTSALVGVPALRLRGLALAVVTLAFALATSTWLLRQEFMLGAGRKPAQPLQGDLSFGEPRNYYLLALGMLAIAFWLTRNLRRGGMGRVWLALRDNEDAARALALSAPARKLQVYAVAGAMAGLGGIVSANALTLVDFAAFPVGNSINVVTASVIGGLGTLIGPVLGTFYVEGIPSLLNLDVFVGASVTLSWLVLIVVVPSGLGGLLHGVRRWVADGLARMSGIDPEQARAADSGGGEQVMRSMDLSRLAAAGAPSDAGLDVLTHGEVLPAGATAPRPARTAARATTGGRRAAGATPSTDQPILQVTGLAKSYGGVRAVRGVDLAVTRGEILGIIGPNGAGKTTVFEMVAGFVSPDEGTVRLAGDDITGLTPEARARRGLVRSFQAARLFPTMSVLDTVVVAQEHHASVHLLPSILGADLAESRRYRRAGEMLELMGLTGIAHRPVGTLSTGTRRMVELAACLALDPSVLLLDEPAGGIAQSEGDVLVELFGTVRRELGTTLVVIEHDLPLLFRLADRLVAMELGQVIAEGSPEEVRRHPDVVRSYLGGEPAAVARSGDLTPA